MPIFERQQIQTADLKEPVKAKWPEKLLEEGYVPFPKRLLRTLSKLFGDSVAVDEIAVILAIVDYKRPQLRRQPSLDYLAFTAGIPVERFKEILRGLAAKGWVNLKAGSTRNSVEIDLQGFHEQILKAAIDEEMETCITLD